MRFGRVVKIAIPGSWQERVIAQFREERGVPEAEPVKRTRHGPWRPVPALDLKGEPQSDACRCEKCELVVRYRRGGRQGGLVREESSDGGRTWRWCTGASPGRPSPCTGRRS